MSAQLGGQAVKMKRERDWFSTLQTEVHEVFAEAVSKLNIVFFISARTHTINIQLFISDSTHTYYKYSALYLRQHSNIL